MKETIQDKLEVYYRRAEKEQREQNEILTKHIELALCSTDLNNVRTILRAALIKAFIYRADAREVTK
jgi:hypothetical protein